MKEIDYLSIIDKNVNSLKEITLKLNEPLVQLETIELLNSISNIIKDPVQFKSIPRKKFTDYQQTIEDVLFNIVLSNKTSNYFVNNCIINVYVLLFDYGLSTRVSDLINKFSNIISSSKYSTSIKIVSIYLQTEIACRTMYIPPQLSELVGFLIKNYKSNDSIMQIKIEIISSMTKLFNKKQPNLNNIFADTIKFISKQNHNNSDLLMHYLDLLESLIFFINSNNCNSCYEVYSNIIYKCYESDNLNLQNKAINLFIQLHSEKIFDSEIDLRRILRRKQHEQPKNFLEVLLCYGQILIFSESNDFNVKISMIKTVSKLIERNSEYLNSSESLILKVYDLMFNHFQLTYSETYSKDYILKICDKKYLNRLNNNQNVKLDFDYGTDLIAFEIEELYKTFIKIVYNSSFRQQLFKHITKKLNTFKGKLDKLENLNVTNIDFKIRIDNKTGKEIKEIVNDGKDQSNKQKENNSQKEIGFNEGQINVLLISLIEFSESDFNIFLIVYPDFVDFSQILLIYLTSSIRSFRILVNKVLVNLAYNISSYRTSMLPLILNLCSVTHAEQASFKNSNIYSFNCNSNDWKYIVMVSENLSLLKDVCNCLGVVLSCFQHKFDGLSYDLSMGCLSIAKNMIIGKYTDENEFSKSLSIEEKSKKINFINVDSDHHKEAGWIIIEGLCAMDETWIKNYSPILFKLWDSVFNPNSSKLDKIYLDDINFKESYISEFFIRKASFSALRKFILFCRSKNIIKYSTDEIISYIIEAFNFFFKLDVTQLFIDKSDPAFTDLMMNEYIKLKSLFLECILSIDLTKFSTDFIDNLHVILVNDVLKYEFYLDMNKRDLNEYKNSFNKDTKELVQLYELNNREEYEFPVYFSAHLQNFENDIKPIKDISYNQGFVSNSFIEKYNINFSDRIFLYDSKKSPNRSNNFTSKMLYLSINTLIEILLNDKIKCDIENEKSKIIEKTFKTFLSNMNDVKSFKDNIKLDRYINIVFCLFLLMKKATLRHINLMENDESIFISSKMIFDIGLKFENILIQTFSVEGTIFMIGLKSEKIIESYYQFLESKIGKLKTDENHESQFYLYLAANITKFTNDLKILSQLVNLYCELLVKSSSTLSVLSGKFVNKSFMVMCDLLIKKAINLKSSKYSDLVKQVIKYFKTTHLFIRNACTHYLTKEVKDKDVDKIRDKDCILTQRMITIRNSESIFAYFHICRLLIDQEIIDDPTTISFFKKMITDELYKKDDFRYYFLRLIKDIIIEKDSKLLSIKDISEFLNYIKNIIIDEESYSIQEKKIAIQILIIIITSQEISDVSAEIFKICFNKLNCIRNKVNNSFFLNECYMNIYELPSTNQFLFYDNNSSKFITSLSCLKNVIESFYSEKSRSDVVFFDNINPLYMLYKHLKVLFKLYVEKMTFYQKNSTNLINLIKDISSNSISFYLIKNSEGNLTSQVEVKNSKKNDVEYFKFPNNVKYYISNSIKIYFLKLLISNATLYLDILSPKMRAIYMQTKSSSSLVEILNIYMSNCLNLINNIEEIPEIKYNALIFLCKILTIFKDYSDTSLDYQFLLLQSWEAGVNSGIKSVLSNSNSSPKSIFIVLKVLYKLLTIPIISETGFLSKKFDLLIDSVNLKEFSSKVNLNEKNEFLYACKKLNLMCYLYMSKCNRNDLKIICVETLSMLENEEINLLKNKELANELKSYFNLDRTLILLINLLEMLHDFSNVVKLDQKRSLLIKYNYLHSGNRITFDSRKILQYSQIYIFVLGLILNDIILEHKIDLLSFEIINSLMTEKKRVLNNSISQINFIFYLISYLVNYTGLKYIKEENKECKKDIELSNHGVNSSKFDNSGVLKEINKDTFMSNINNQETVEIKERKIDDDITWEFKEKVLFKLLLTNKLLDSYIIILRSNLVILDSEFITENINFLDNLLRLNESSLTYKVYLVYSILSQNIKDYKIIHIFYSLISIFYSKYDISFEQNISDILSKKSFLINTFIMINPKFEMVLLEICVNCLVSINSLVIIDNNVNRFSSMNINLYLILINTILSANSSQELNYCFTKFKQVFENSLIDIELKLTVYSIIQRIVIELIDPNLDISITLKMEKLVIFLCILLQYTQDLNTEDLIQNFNQFVENDIDVTVESGNNSNEYTENDLHDEHKIKDISIIENFIKSRFSKANEIKEISFFNYLYITNLIDDMFINKSFSSIQILIKAMIVIKNQIEITKIAEIILTKIIENFDETLYKFFLNEDLLNIILYIVTNSKDSCKVEYVNLFITFFNDCVKYIEENDRSNIKIIEALGFITVKLTLDNISILKELGKILCPTYMMIIDKAYKNYNQLNESKQNNITSNYNNNVNNIKSSNKKEMGEIKFKSFTKK